MDNRTEGVVRMECAMWSLVAWMFAEHTRVLGMQAENKCREQRGLSVAYDESEFREAETDLMDTADMLRKL